MLSISKEQFREIYKDTSVAKYEHLFYSKPATDKELKENYLVSKLWRLNNIYTIIDKDGNKVLFRMNLSQHKVYAKSLIHPRLIILKSRQQGISTFWLVFFFDDACVRSNFSIGLMAQGQDESSTLLTRVKLLWDELAPSIKTYLKIKLSVDNTKALTLSNGSSIFVRTSFRSTTLQRLHISEMGKIANNSPKKAKETKTGTLQTIAAGNIVAIESTAEGDNMFKTMWDNAVTKTGELASKDFLAVFLSWIDDPTCISDTPETISDKEAKYFERIESELKLRLSPEQKNFWIMQYRELGEDIYQEYPTTAVEAFMANKDGAYYARLYLIWVVQYRRVVENLYDPNLDVQVAVDLGMDDTNVLTVFQDYNDSTRIIDEIYDNGQDIAYYCDELKVKPYFSKINHVILPHDAEVKELTSGKTRKRVFQDELPGVNITVLERLAIADGIEAVRQLIKRLWIDERCKYLINCLLNYTKEWDEKRERWRNKPNHDEYSNGADSVRYMALGAHTTVLRQRRRMRQQGHDV